ncbi:hypothetical protein Pst134EA_005363 [Puccinia striiformis f. sp. tritici]|uniref:hypothetical protein n=1 Tax=Puccinia striiformis f. sp. tritici TaxID=168172 RepID=UPI002007267C|nr:hypothetical protein Pst134EA_005363 [Puccinia striiformis f. sp. tritici]KAH9471464.1 hypothetical protein Pst134EA_005363 [Puccinia striiformis f. sp. tritici]
MQRIRRFELFLSSRIMPWRWQRRHPAHQKLRKASHQAQDQEDLSQPILGQKLRRHLMHEWVNGWDDIYDKKQRLSKCTWIEPGEVNNRRPWCKRCTHQNFKDLPFPEPPHVKDTL